MSVLWLATAAVVVHIAWSRGRARGFREGVVWQERNAPVQAAFDRMYGHACPLCDGSGVFEGSR